MTEGSLTLSNVRVRCAGRTILQIDGLSIPAGEFVGILGANGAGKTTLLRVCAGLIQPNGGSVSLDDNDLTRLGRWGRCAFRKRIGYVPQSAEYNAELPFTVREVVVMGRTSVRPLLAALRKDDYAIVDHWTEMLGLADRRNQTFRSLSGGEQQKVLLARAMAQNPQILMLDEPCANLDFHWKYQIMEIVERLYRRSRMTVLMVSHDVSVLPPSCRRIILLADGCIRGDGGIEEVLSPDMLRAAYRTDLAVIDAGAPRHVS
jgi:iron complex transport system ATP-binding protein